MPDAGSGLGKTGADALLAATFSVSTIGMAHIDPVTRRFVAVNAALCRMSGYEPDELLRMDVDQLNHPDDPLDQGRFKALLSGTADYVAQKRLVRKDGRIVPIEVTGAVVRDAAGKPLRVVGVIQDVTARHAAEAALREREARQAFLMRLSDRLRALSDPVAIGLEAMRLLGEHVGAQRVGFAEDLGDGESARVNPGFANGVAPIEGVYRYRDFGSGLLEALKAGRTLVWAHVAAEPSLTPEDKKGYVAMEIAATVLVPLLRGGRLNALFFINASAPRAWTAHEVALFEMVAERVHSELDRARAEALLRATHDRLGAALAAMTDSVFISDAQGRMLDVNEAFVRFHRLRDRSEAGPMALEEWTRLLEVLRPDGSPAPISEWPVSRALRGDAASNVEFDLHRRDTGARWSASYSFAPIRDAQGRMAGAVVTARDITAMKRMHTELEAVHAELQALVAAQARVQEDERLRIGRELHDDTLQRLAAIMMEATVLRDELGSRDESARAALMRIEKAAAQAVQAARRIIQDLRPQVLEELGLVAALASMARQFTRRTGLVCTVDADDLSAVDEAGLVPQATCLYRVAQEALHNVERHAGARHVRIRLASEPGPCVRMQVADDGTGMPQQRKRGAYGLLGMRERVRAAGGTLRIDSQPDQGTTVSVDVPVPLSTEA